MSSKALITGVVVLALIGIALLLASCRENYGLPNSSVHGEAGAPVYTEGTPDETFARIDPTPHD